MDSAQPTRCWSRALRYPALRTGLLVGVGLAGVAVAWLLVANRVPSFDRFALDRNFAAVAAVALLMLIPGCLFLRSPGAMFLSGIVAWTVLTVAYRLMELIFQGLAEHMGAFHLFMLGGLVVGLVAALDWVAHLLWLARRQPVRVTRRRLP